MIVESSVSAKLSKLIPLISTAIVSSLKELLEKKHLYQKATVNWPNLEDALQIGLLEKRDREDSREWENIHSISQVVEWSLAYISHFKN